MKFALQTSQEHNMVNNIGINWANLWKLKLHDRLKMLIWRIGSDVLLTKSNLALRLDLSDTCCPFCHKKTENLVHLFFKCEIAIAIWFGSCWGLHSDQLDVNSSVDIVELVTNPSIFSSDPLNKKTLLV